MTPQKTVLVVDDNPDVRGSVTAALERRGYRVLTAADGNQGLAVAEQSAPDLVVVDMMMPRRSGLLVLEKLKAGAVRPRVIMITANEGGRHRAYAEALGVDDYLRKPFALEQLVASVERLCPLADGTAE
jgi:DNA-binding response OmpR family regulator